MAFLDDTVSALRAVAEPSRLRLLVLCAHSDLTVSELVRITGQSQPRISRHLKVLTDAAVLERFTEGSWVFHRIARKGFGARLAAHLLGSVTEDDPVFAGDASRLAEVQADRAVAASQYFRANADNWDRVRSLYVDEAEVERALAALWPNTPVTAYLDAGTGTGRLIELFGPRSENAYGVDISTEMLSVARAALDRAGLDQCSVRHADLYQLPFNAGEMNVVSVHQVLHFLADPARAIAETSRVLAPGGRLLIVDFAPHDVEALRTDHAHRRLGFSDAEVSGWMQQAGLTVAKPRHLPGTPLTVTIWMGEKPVPDSHAESISAISEKTERTA